MLQLLVNVRIFDEKAVEHETVAHFARLRDSGLADLSIGATGLVDDDGDALVKHGDTRMRAFVRRRAHGSGEQSTLVHCFWYRALLRQQQVRPQR